MQRLIAEMEARNHSRGEERPTASTRRRVAIAVVALAAFFVFRLLYGLSRITATGPMGH